MTLDDLQIPDDPGAIREALLAAVAGGREAWVALRMIREALEARGPVRDADGLGYLDEADALVEAIVNLCAPAAG